MRDIETYLGKKAVSAAVSEPAAFTGGKENFDFGEKGGLGYFPDVYIKCFISAGELTSSNTVTITVQHKDEGSYTTAETLTVAGPFKAGDSFRVKLPAEHKRFVTAKISTTGSGAYTVEAYLERG